MAAGTFRNISITTVDEFGFTKSEHFLQLSGSDFFIRIKKARAAIYYRVTALAPDGKFFIEEKEKEKI